MLLCTGGNSVRGRLTSLSFVAQLVALIGLNVVAERHAQVAPICMLDLADMCNKSSLLCLPF